MKILPLLFIFKAIVIIELAIWNNELESRNKRGLPKNGREAKKD
ncbi:hypothetical protein SAMN02746042_00461 [Fructilactobacillus lindneri DSM 20690 = JCM 11027]|nr:hypothetical protein SAMN02746042_00461 [Fructilactobacillus lindneri DSM 20690 = JCM 11027]